VRALEVPNILDGLTYAQVSQALPPLCVALMQNLSSEDQAAIGEQSAKLEGDSMPDSAKVLSLGLMLVNFVGDDVLRGAVEALRAQLKQAGKVGASKGGWAVGARANRGCVDQPARMAPMMNRSDLPGRSCGTHHVIEFWRVPSEFCGEAARADLAAIERSA
jgi:hypothetical protein